MQLATRVAYNAMVQIVGKGVSTFLGLLAVAMMTRYLGSAGFGQYTTIITFVSIFAIVADLGLTLVASQLINRPQADIKYLLGNLFGFRLVSALVIIGLAPLVVWLFPYGREIKIGVSVISFSYLFFSFNQVYCCSQIIFVYLYVFYLHGRAFLPNHSPAYHFYTINFWRYHNAVFN